MAGRLLATAWTWTDEHGTAPAGPGTSAGAALSIRRWPLRVGLAGLASDHHVARLEPGDHARVVAVRAAKLDTHERWRAVLENEDRAWGPVSLPSLSLAAARLPGLTLPARGLRALGLIRLRLVARGGLRCRGLI
jgi:hypothetical protein